MAIGTERLSEPTAPPIAIDPLLPLELYRLSIDQYHRMVESGIISEDERVELLEGCLVRRMTKKPPHVVATGLVQDALTPLLPAGWHVSVQDPITTDDSEPEPDIKVVRGARRDYATRHPGPGDVALVVEVAESSLTGGRGIKKRIYARAAVPHYWILNLTTHKLEAYTDPTGPDPTPNYRQWRDFDENEWVSVVLHGQDVGRLRLANLLP